MAARKPIREITAYSDFETTIDNPVVTEVWAAATILGGVPNDPQNVLVQKNLGDYMEYIFNIPGNRIKIYFHNLKFDGSFILYWLLNCKWLSPLYTLDEQGQINGLEKMNAWEMPACSFTYTISSTGQWYSITIRTYNKIVTIWDSLKLMPMPLKALGRAFKTPHQKLDMEYSGHTPNSYISPEELKYIQNDVLVLKECMEYMHSQNIDSMTIGGACLSEYLDPIPEEKQTLLFPDLTMVQIPDLTGWDLPRSTGRTADSFIRRSYHGGFCYVNPKYQGKMISTHAEDRPDVLAESISHVDANSHYPSMMHSRSGNYYPVGQPYYITADDFPKFEKLPTSKFYYFVRVLGSFELKPDHLPTLQIKDDPRFRGHSNEWLTSSMGHTVDIVLTCTDYRKLLENYEANITVLEAVGFKTEIGLFDKYINHWYGIKEHATGAERQIAKLFLNNLYGKFAASTDSSYKIARVGARGGLSYMTVQANDKTPGYIAIGSAITSYARNRTITLAETYIDYYVYSDTDSNVYLLPEESLEAIPKHPTAICYWGVESESDNCIFARQKTYIEHVVKNDSKPVEAYWNVKACGMGAISKSITNQRLNAGMDLREFRSGFSVEGTLKARQIAGGTLLVDAGYCMR